MAAASTDPTMRGALLAGVGERMSVATGALAAGVACVLMVSGAATLPRVAGFSQHASALWMSALALATMMAAPWLIARSHIRHSTLASAAILIATMSAMSAWPAYLNGLQHGGFIAALMVVAGSVLIGCWRRLVCNAEVATPLAVTHHSAVPQEPSRRLGATALLALFAGLSSGTLARFQIFALCGSSGGSSAAQSVWQIAASLAAVCALAWIADRTRGDRMLLALYVMRAALIGALATLNHPALAMLSAKVFLLLDCVTIPALANLRTRSSRALSASCPGIAHHMGMLCGAALSTTQYFFNDGFVVLFALSAAANLVCAVSLAGRWHGVISVKAQTRHAFWHRHHRAAHSSS